MKRLLSARVFGAIAAAWAILIFALSLMPNPPQVKQVQHVDKLEHAAALAFLTVVLGRWLEGKGRYPHPWRTAFVLALLYGVSIEVAQLLLTSSRSAELADLIADAIGAGIASAVMASSRRDNP